MLTHQTHNINVLLKGKRLSRQEMQNSSRGHLLYSNFNKGKHIFSTTAFPNIWKGTWWAGFVKRKVSYRNDKLGRDKKPKCLPCAIWPVTWALPFPPGTYIQYSGWQARRESKGDIKTGSSRSLSNTERKRWKQPRKRQGTLTDWEVGCVWSTVTLRNGGKKPKCIYKTFTAPPHPKLA